MRWITVFLLCTAVTGISWAQESDRVESDLSVIWGVPQGDFADNITQPGIGISGSVGGRVPGSPFVLFSEIGFLNYGLNDHLELTRFREQFEDVDFTVPVSTLSVESDNNILMGHLVARLQPSSRTVNPYLDALLGFKYFFTNTRVSGDVAFDWNNLNAFSDFDDLAPSFGAGGGVRIQMFDGHLGSDTRSSKLSVDLGIRYLFGPETTYLPQNAIRQTEEGISFAVEESQTNMLIPKFGLRIER